MIHISFGINEMLGELKKPEVNGTEQALRSHVVKEMNLSKTYIDSCLVF
jgi:hypothetical protein